MLKMARTIATTRPPYFMPFQPTLQRNSMLLPAQSPSQLPSQHLHNDEARTFDALPPLLSHALFRLLMAIAFVFVYGERETSCFGVRQ